MSKPYLRQSTIEEADKIASLTATLVAGYLSGAGRVSPAQHTIEHLTQIAAAIQAAADDHTANRK